jgi:NitT/TauT family transport system ATP-binding protein
MTEQAFIKLDRVVKTYPAAGGPVPALSATSATVREGEFVSIVGPSGCGKTTLLKMIGGLIDVTSGEIVLRGTSVAGPRDDVGFVFQGAVLLPWKTVLQNVLLPLQVHRPITAKDRARALELLDDPAELDRVLAANAAKADTVADVTLADVYDKVGLLRRV